MSLFLALIIIDLATSSWINYRPIVIYEDMYRNNYHSVRARPSLPILITISFNRSQSPLHYFREFIHEFWETRETVIHTKEQCTSTLLYLTLFQKNDFRFVWTKLTHLPMSHFSTVCYQIRPRISTRINSTSNLTLNSRFREAAISSAIWSTFLSLHLFEDIDSIFHIFSWKEQNTMLIASATGLTSQYL